MEVDFKGIKAVVFDFDGTLYNNRHFPFWFVMADLSEQKANVRLTNYWK